MMVDTIQNQNSINASGNIDFLITSSIVKMCIRDSYKSDEYNSREYRYSNLSELRKAMKHKEGGNIAECSLSTGYILTLHSLARLIII